MNQKIYQKVLGILEHKGFGENVTPESRMVEDLGMDSLDTVEIIMEVEREFNTTISDDDAVEIKTIQDMVNYLDKALNPVVE